MAVWDIRMRLARFFFFWLQTPSLSSVNKILEYLIKMKPTLLSWGKGQKPSLIFPHVISFQFKASEMDISNES